MATPGGAPPQRILLIKPSSLGDVVHALPVLVALRRGFPRAHIAWLIGSSFAPLLASHPLIDELIPFDRTRLGRMWRSAPALREFVLFVRALRARRFDLIVDLQGLFRSGFLAWASGAAQRVGFSSARELAWLFYTRRVECPVEAVHAVDRNVAVARALGLPLEAPEFPLAVQAGEIAQARALLDSAAGGRLGSFVAIVPGARWVTKQWLPERIAELIDRIHAGEPTRCVLLGAPADRAIAAQIIAHVRSAPLDLVGRTSLRLLTAILALADRVICHDSGPMHLAAALQRPITAIFGPTAPARTGPYGSAAAIAATPIECSPCYRRTCSHHSCMQRLTVESVLATDTGSHVSGRPLPLAPAATDAQAPPANSTLPA